ncbi:hypothetical protein U2F26_20775 [Micromonospora sp. 4G57]|uniref:Uncharacterized protein n=1 Tax=Micromonospora sicca TaxID=2202420 RepID=A0ABU5JF07_9ACTN|nr:MULTISPECIES: hypothetical protein [unclassified Micromonospora]MDZ5445140.1 hypothetical protein [Micromonospora sp. 4G57]MDZ5490984.1 hypothetical protein [Micromonospora sp. 4G53]
MLAAAGMASGLGLLVASPVFDTLWLVGLYGWTLWPLLAAITLGLRWMRLRRS